MWVPLLQAANVEKDCIQPMAIYFLIEILALVEALHSLNIIHADIKADNFLLKVCPFYPLFIALKRLCH
jgi:tRNA A-37 threonylcarbamoyl transferase component Bud32